MTHWTSHAFHATVVSPRMMYEDVTMGFTDGSVIFTGRPLRNWRAWAWVALVIRLTLVAAGVVALTTVAAPVLRDGLSIDLLVRAAVVVALWALAMWLAGTLMRRYVQVARLHATERTSKLPVSDVSMARLRGRTLSIRAPFDEGNSSDRWRLRLDSHDQGESLLALLGQR
jgi:hypothetical protein